MLQIKSDLRVEVVVLTNWLRWMNIQLDSINDHDLCQFVSMSVITRSTLENYTYFR